MHNSLNDPLKKLASLYVLDALSESEVTTFEQELATNEELQSYVQTLEGTLDVTSQHAMNTPDEFDLQHQRNLLKANIQSILSNQQTSISLLDKIKHWVQSPMPAWVNLVSISGAFLIGFYMMKQPIIQSETTQPNIKELIQTGQLGQIKFTGNGQRDDQIRFAVESKQDLEYAGTAEDELITDLLLYLLLHDQNPGKRLKAVKLLQNTQPAQNTKMVLVSSLLTDPNPGIRLKSIRLLTSYESDKTIKDACMKVLLEDENEAVRLAAIDIMELSPDVSMAPALQVVSALEENPFIRDRAKELLSIISDDETLSNLEVKS